MFFSQLFRPGCITTYPNSGCMTHFSRLTRWAKKILKFQKFYKISEWSLSPAIDEAQMKLSESDSKFVQGFCWRKTFTIKIEGKFTIWSFLIFNTDKDIVKLQKDQHHDGESGPFRSPLAAHPPRMEHVEGKFTRYRS